MSNGTINPWGAAPAGPNPFSREGAGPHSGLGNGWERERVSYMEKTQEIALPKLQPTPTLPEPERTTAIPAGPSLQSPYASGPQHYLAPQPAAYQPSGFGHYEAGHSEYGQPTAPRLPVPTAAFSPQYANMPVNYYAQGYYPYAPLRNAPMAVASLVMAIFGIFTLITAPLGVLFGLVGLWQIAHNPSEYRGRGLAWSGLILGAIMTTLTALIFLWASTL